MTSDVADLTTRIRNHWLDRGDLGRVQQLLERRGVSPDQLGPAELAVLDQMHAGQLEATRALIEWAELDGHERVLDVGSGLGGSARYLASELGCQVTALELVPELDAAGQELTRWLGLTHAVDHRLGDITSLSVGDFEPYDVVLLQHVDMHIEDKVAAYERCRALLKPETAARVVWHDWLSGPGGEILFPVPWSAEDEEITFLSTQDQFRTSLVAAGLALHKLQPLPTETAVWFSNARAQVVRVLDKASVHGRVQLEALLAEIDGALGNVAELRLLPIFAEARRVD